MLTEIMHRQEEVKALLQKVREEQDRTIEEGLAASTTWPDDKIIAVVLVRLEMSQEPDRPVEIIDLIWAGEFLDHLDTQNMAVRSKMRKTNALRTES